MMNIGVCFVMELIIIANDSDKTLETIVINYANTIGFSYHYEKLVLIVYLIIIFAMVFYVILLFLK